MVSLFARSVVFELELCFSTGALFFFKSRFLLAIVGSPSQTLLRLRVRRF